MGSGVLDGSGDPSAISPMAARPLGHPSVRMLRADGDGPGAIMGSARIAGCADGEAIEDGAGLGASTQSASVDALAAGATEALAAGATEALADAAGDVGVAARPLRVTPSTSTHAPATAAPTGPRRDVDPSITRRWSPGSPVRMSAPVT
jgi:hypothetical protein